MKEEIYHLSFPAADERRKPKAIPGAFGRWLRRRIHLILFFTTLSTTLFIGAFTVADFYIFEHGGLPAGLNDPLSIILYPQFFFPTLAYAAALLGFLSAHEMGHYIVCRKHGLDASLPYYLPNPLFFGTFGAVIRIRSPIRNKKILFDIGVAGPLSGFAVALPVLLIGTAISITVPSGTVTSSESFWILGEPLVQKGVNIFLFAGRQNIDVVMSPLALVGWFGLLVTALNLLPVSQLDGGHIIYAVFGKRHHFISLAVVTLMVLVAIITQYYGWLFWAILVAVLGLRHPALPDESKKLDVPRLVLAFLAMLIFIGCFVPVPIEVPELFDDDWSSQGKAIDPPLDLRLPPDLADNGFSNDPQPG